MQRGPILPENGKELAGMQLYQFLDVYLTFHQDTYLWAVNPGLSKHAVLTLQAVHSGPRFFSCRIFQRPCRFVVADDPAGKFRPCVLHQCCRTGG